MKRCTPSELEAIAVQLKADSPPETQQEIETRLSSVISEWNTVVSKLSGLLSSLGQVESTWSSIEERKTALEDWLREVCPAGKVTNLQRVMEELPSKMTEMNELHISWITLSLEDSKSTRKIPFTLELEGISRKLEFLKSYLSTVHEEIDKETPETGERICEQAAQTLASVSAEQSQQTEGGDDEPSRIPTVQSQLLRLGELSSKMKACGGQKEDLGQALVRSQSLFHSTFEEYVRLWSSLPEGGIHLLEDSLSRCADYLGKSEQPTSYAELVEESSMLEVHRKLLSGPSECLASAVEAGHPELSQTCSDLLLKLTEREEAFKAKLVHWSQYKKSHDSFSKWIHFMEREKREMDLPFLQLKRLPIIKAKVDSLLKEVADGEAVLQDFKSKGERLPEFPEISSQLSSATNRLNNITAALNVWSDKVARLMKLGGEANKTIDEVSSKLDQAAEALRDIERPVNFVGWKQCIPQLEKIYGEVASVDLDKLSQFTEEMNESLSPSDAKLLDQRVRSLLQQKVEILSTLGDMKREAERKLDLIPDFDLKCVIHIFVS